MVFSSLQFLFIFMPIFFAVYYLVPNTWRNAVLLLGSLAFYGVGAWQHPAHFAMLCLNICMDFWLGMLLDKQRAHAKIWLTLGVLVHIFGLLYFKYFNFLAGECNTLFATDITHRVVLPIGISFYTFQGLSYLFDVYRGRVRAEQSLMRFAVYISMFEQLIAGPIVTYSQIQTDLKKREISVRSALHGLRVFVFGLGLKVLLANPLGKVFTEAQHIGFDSISTPLAWLSILAFSLQIYFDFFGYSLMAIGLGHMLGFRIPRNFNFPYLSCSMTEFWRRWHMTLGSWFREYVYIPLGGSQKGVARMLFNLLVVWLLTGIWHGAGYHFIVWGFTLFVLIAAEKLFLGKYLNRYPWLGHLYMLLVIPLTWAIFAIEDFSELGLFMTRLFPDSIASFWSVFPGDSLKYLRIYWPFFLVGIFFCTRLPYRWLRNCKRPVFIHFFLIAVFLGSVYCLYRGFDDPFLYFRF